MSPMPIPMRGRRQQKARTDLMEVTMMGNLWEHRLLAEDDKNLIKAFADYCKEKKNITTKYLFLKCSDEERTQAWLEIVSKLPMELVKKIDSVMQEIQKDRGSRPKSNVTTAVTKVATAMTNPATTTLATMTPATTSPATSSLNPTNDIMFAGLFGLNDAEKRKFVRKQERDLRKI
jgi:hypothetical protein